MSDNVLGEKIKERRDMIGISQEELASRVGTHATCVSQWENGQRIPGGEKIPKIAESLHCPIDALFGWRDHEDQTVVRISLDDPLTDSEVMAVKNFARTLDERWETENGN